jgi:hypothetical protein
MASNGDLWLIHFWLESPQPFKGSCGMPSKLKCHPILAVLFAPEAATNIAWVVLGDSTRLSSLESNNITLSVWVARLRFF